MELKEKIRLVQVLLDQADKIEVESHNDPDFIIWRSKVERTLSTIFGSPSIELNFFRKLDFYYNPNFSIRAIGGSGTHNDKKQLFHLNCFRHDFALTKKTLLSYIGELQEGVISVEPTSIKAINGLVDVVNNPLLNTNMSTKKVFMSHSSIDKFYVDELIELLEIMGLDSNQIFCSSFDGYNISLGENYLERLRMELNEESLVLFILSENFYKSPICLCEMGATWIKTKEHIPILIPPFDFDDIKGVIPLTQGFKINDHLKLNELKLIIDSFFALLPKDNSTWERKRDKVLGRINHKLNPPKLKIDFSNIT